MNSSLIVSPNSLVLDNLAHGPLHELDHHIMHIDLDTMGLNLDSLHESENILSFKEHKQKRKLDESDFNLKEEKVNNEETKTNEVTGEIHHEGTVHESGVQGEIGTDGEPVHHTSGNHDTLP